MTDAPEIDDGEVVLQTALAMVAAGTTDDEQAWALYERYYRSGSLESAISIAMKLLDNTPSSRVSDTLGLLARALELGDGVEEHLHGRRRFMTAYPPDSE